MYYNLKKQLSLLLVVLAVFSAQTIYAHNKLFIEKRTEPVSFFVDRVEAIKEIQQNLNQHKIVSIIGITNIGKTELIRKYAQENKGKYEVIWFFDSALDLNEQFTNLSKMINLSILKHSTHKISEEKEKSQKEAVEFLEGRRNWLLIFDNLKLGQNGVVKNIISGHHNGHIILCSQDSQDLPNNVYVHKLDSENSLMLIRKILPKTLKDGTVGELLGVFNGYPGLIVQGSSLLKEHTYLSINEYKNILAKSPNPIRNHMELVLNLLDEKGKKLISNIAVLNNHNFSKKFLSIIFKDNPNLGESIFDLIRFGLIKNLGGSGEKTHFEMHDEIKNSLLQLLAQQEIKELISGTIDKLNSLMSPKGVTNRYAFIVSDATISSNLEVLLANAEQYGVNLPQILELRRNLIDYYVPSLDYYNVEKMKNWLITNQNFLEPAKMSTEQKINYSWYLTDIGIYEHFAKSNFAEALSYFDKAKNIVKELGNIPELESTILFQTAQAQIYGGELANAEKSMEEADLFIKKNLKADIDMGLYWFLKARVALAKGLYKEALIFIDNNIRAEEHLPRDTFTAPTFIVKSEILNYAEDYKNSYEIITKIKTQETANNNPEHEIHGRILTQLSRAELGLGRIEVALKDAVTACDIFQKHLDQPNINSVVNPEYAAALVAKADALYKKGDFEQALEDYNQAEMMYVRKYGSNSKYMDDVVYLVCQGAKVACSIGNTFWKNHFYGQLMNFDELHPRVNSVMEFCNNRGD